MRRKSKREEAGALVKSASPPRDIFSAARLWQDEMMNSVVSASRSRTCSARKKVAVDQSKIGKPFTTSTISPEGDGAEQRKSAKESALHQYRVAQARRNGGYA